MVKNHRMHFTLDNHGYNEIKKLKKNLEESGFDISLSKIINFSVLLMLMEINQEDDPETTFLKIGAFNNFGNSLRNVAEL